MNSWATSSLQKKALFSDSPVIRAIDIFPIENSLFGLHDLVNFIRITV